MNKSILKITLALCLLYLYACSATNTVSTFTPAAAITDKAIVYIYRPTEMANALHSPGLNIDDEFKLYVKNSMNSRISLPPGEHVFEFQAEKEYSDLTPLPLKLNAGTISYIRVSTSLKIHNSGDYQPYVRSFKFTLVEESLAKKEIAACCVTNKKEPKTKKETPSADKESDQGFSVDKTQNPFSH